MSWTIDRDYYAEGHPLSDGLREPGDEPPPADPEGSAVGTKGYGVVVTRETPGAKRFYLYDDDGGLGASGWLLEDDACPYTGDAWLSVFEFGQWNWGCTVVKDGSYKAVVA